MEDREHRLRNLTPTLLGDISSQRIIRDGTPLLHTQHQMFRVIELHFRPVKKHKCALKPY